MSQQQATAIIGLGSMGYGMASSVLRAGHNAYGFDVAAPAVERFVAEGGNIYLSDFGGDIFEYL